MIGKRRYRMLVRIFAPRFGLPALAGLIASLAAAASEPSAAEPAFVGRAVCAECHAEQDRLWQGSHHDLAMQEANQHAVLGDFDGAEFRKDGVVSRFFRRDGRYWVRTDGPDGKLADFEIKYTFGFSPLQQYLVELGRGRLQALSIAWDSRPRKQGGQRWFHLYPGEKIDHNDELHWTRPSQNWNFMCAECHSTHLQKNYDAATRSYRTTWSEIDVACEACHGPGSRHAAWGRTARPGGHPDDANKGLSLSLDERRGAAWTLAPGSSSARRSLPRTGEKEIQTCARCHARRAQLFGDYRNGAPLLDSHLPAWLETPLYHADGQIEGEVYEYGSFLQSRMYREGVTCSDCHEPHSLKLRAAGNGVCLQCHTAAKFDTPTHHFHQPGKAGSRCIDCHMPTKTYMEIDVRRDHGFRVPRPDRSAKLGTPNACTACHAGQPARWAVSALKRWNGHDPAGYQDYAEIFAAARAGTGDAEAGVIALLGKKSQPAIARATAAAEIGRRLRQESTLALAEAVTDADPLVRASAVQTLAQLPPDASWRFIRPALRDTVRVVRALAAGALAGIPLEQMPPDDRTNFLKATDEYLTGQRFNADTPAAHVNLGNFHTARGETAAAEQAYREALILDPGWEPAYANLADLYRQTGRDDEGAALLKQGLALRPRAASLHHALGLLEIRRRNLDAALTSLKRAAELAPREPHFSLVYAMALQSAGRLREAMNAVKEGLRHAPEDPSLRELQSRLIK